MRGGEHAGSAEACAGDRPPQTTRSSELALIIGKKSTNTLVSSPGSIFLNVQIL